MQKLIFLSLLTILATSCSTGDALVLKFKLPEKTTFRYTYKMDQDITTATMGMEQDQRQMEAIEYEYKVLKTLSDGTKDIMVTIMEVAIEQDSPTGTVRYDSKSGDAAIRQMERIYEKMVGQEFRMKMSPDGKVSDVSGADKMMDDLISVAGFPDDEETVNAVKTSLKRQFGNLAMEENMSLLTAFYPEKPVRPGDTWEKTITRRANVGLVVTTTYKLISRGKGKAYIDFSSTIDPLEDAEPLEMGVMSIEYNLSGQQTGSMVVDETTGWTEESEVHQLLGGDMKIMSAELPFGAIEGTMEAKSIITMSKIEN